MKISEIITDKYKLRIPPTVYYELLADVQEAEEEQEPKIGHWIKYGIPRCGEQHYKCTNCDEYFNFGVYSDYYKKAFKFCPNCGAKMVESEK